MGEVVANIFISRYEHRTDIVKILSQVGELLVPGELRQASFKLRHNSGSKGFENLTPRKQQIRRLLAMSSK